MIVQCLRLDFCGVMPGMFYPKTTFYSFSSLLSNTTVLAYLCIFYKKLKPTNTPCTTNNLGDTDRTRTCTPNLFMGDRLPSGSDPDIASSSEIFLLVSATVSW